MDKAFEKEILEVMDIFVSANKDVDTFYHYTTIDALINGIIKERPQKGKEVCLRATHNRFVNDPEEIIKGARLYAQILEQNNSSKSADEHFKNIMRMYDNLFLISFSEENDSLPMWNTYANKSAGITIGFERMKSFSISDLVVKCIYGTDAFTKRLKMFLDSDKFKIGSYLLIYSFVQMLKNEAFEYENEIRLIGDFKKEPVKFREKNGYIIPYKEIYFSKKQIKSITLGPCQNLDNAEYSLRQFLDSKGFEHVMIHKSKIPYRNI